MTKVEIEVVVAAARARVRLACDEYHAHGIQCCVGDERDLALCALSDELGELRARIVEFAKQ